MLAPYRVLDLRNEWGLLCCRLPADHGVEVIRIENPTQLDVLMTSGRSAEEVMTSMVDADISAGVDLRGPMLGEDNDDVCTKILGLVDEAFPGLRADGVLE